MMTSNTVSLKTRMRAGIQKGLILLMLATLSLGASAQDKVGTTAAPFLGLGVGARAMGMGGAQVAAVQGPDALYWNPSAITDMRSHGISFSNNYWLVGSSMQYAGLVFDGEQLGHFGLSVTVLDYGEMEVRTIDRPEGTGELYTPMDLAVGISYARMLTDRFSLGGTVKYIRQSIWNESANGIGVDLGVTYRTDLRGLRIGMSMSNFGTGMQLDGKDLRRAIDVEPDLEGNNDRIGARLETQDWALPLVFRVGIAMDAFSYGENTLRVSIDGLAPADNAQTANFGAEYSFRDMFFLRGGYRQVLGGADYDGGWNYGAGIQYELDQRRSASFDYVFQTHEDFGTQQMFTVGLTF